ncbi:DUF7314 family protein [Haloarchaeobius sp. HRN-SO-5]|uniref:DUF7314 family protein n=1 Tax=Haloarchaeobius sp. HRN-SO-5 TaxID=3446118 RepID=UPI003EB80FB1
MADEFIKGLSIATGAGLIWMVLAGWYNTPGFEETQLLGPNPTDPGAFEAVALIVKDGLFWFMILGALTFWVVIPVARELQAMVATD